MRTYQQFVFVMRYKSKEKKKKLETVYVCNQDPFILSF